MSEETMQDPEEVEVEDEDAVLIEDWAKAGVPKEGAVGLQFTSAEIKDFETEEGDSYRKVYLGAEVIARLGGADPGETVLVNVSLDPQYIKQFKLLTAGLGINLTGPVTMRTIREMVAAIPGRVVYTTLKNKDGFTNMGYKFADSFENLKKVKKARVRG